MVAARIFDGLVDTLPPDVELRHRSMRRRRKKNECFGYGPEGVKVRAFPEPVAGAALAGRKGGIGRRLDERASGAEGKEGLERQAEIRAGLAIVLLYRDAPRAREAAVLGVRSCRRRS